MAPLAGVLYTIFIQSAAWYIYKIQVGHTKMHLEGTRTLISSTDVASPARESKRFVFKQLGYSLISMLLHLRHIESLDTLCCLLKVIYVSVSASSLSLHGAA